MRGSSVGISSHCNFDEGKIEIGCYIRDCLIDLQTLEEIPQALKEIQEGIVTRRDPTCGLVNAHHKGNSLRTH